MVTNGTDFAGRADVGGLGAGGTLFEGSQDSGLNSRPEGKIPLFIINTNKGVYLRVEEGGITVETAGGGAADFGIARLRVTADQVRHVAEGRSLYVGNDDDARPGDYIFP